MKFKRSSGVLLHPTSLPGRYGIGDLGDEAYQFVDFLVESRQKLWQVFPLGHTGYGDSPYQCFSAFAGNPLLISPEKLMEKGLLDDADLAALEEPNAGSVDFGRIIPRRFAALKKAYERFDGSASFADRRKIENFKQSNAFWIGDYALFMALKDHFGGKAWSEWPDDIRKRAPEAMNRFRHELKRSIEYYEFLQWVFFDQWLELKAYANRNYISVIGDLPIYVAFDSADAWANPSLFLFDADCRPTHVAGVPPDYFSATGQLWGNPLFDWERMRETGFAWWIERIKGNIALMDIIRIDHFVGFAHFWAVPAGEKTAIRGEWRHAPGQELFAAVEAALGSLPIVAEDLGNRTGEVVALRKRFGFPGMKILQFAFGPEDGEVDFLPHNCEEQSLMYTGTHDNDTVVGWFDTAPEHQKKHCLSYLDADGVDLHWDMIRSAWGTHSVMAIAQAQDLLGLGSDARMNFPGRFGGNWSWRAKDGVFSEKIAEKLGSLTRLYGR